MDGKKDPNFVTALARGLELMRCYGDAAEYLGNAELAARTGIPRPTVSRLTATLTQLGYLIYVPHLERYRLGPRVLGLGYRYLASEGVSNIARPFMQELADATDCFIALGVAECTQMTYTQTCQGPGPLIMRMGTGSRVPMAYTAIGRAFLAALPADQRRTYCELIQRDDPSAWPHIERALDRADREYEQYGFCVAESEWTRDVSGVGVPLLLENGRRVVAFNCSGSSLRLSYQILTENLGPRLRAMVAQVRELIEGGDDRG
ncbi:IclR family transcriptional regulator [Salinisphaera sp. LB1]|uniref:IclR family transcriptional regulator n=1 Tax=Salinisphaera sp. LB1 TaxID=2183911 RepID=UPI000D7E3930|nr:IclR family transcriptional regulator [Salinisphaera sp. LB1]AWN16886.1 Transcriptional regulator, IclR family [Salinisphaera sp. LB1]